MATPRQLTGLVRMVATIGTSGRGLTSTGMVLTSDGEVVTNSHGVAGATAVQATLMSSGLTYTARVVAANRGRDVALLRLDGASGLAPVTLAPRDPGVGARVTVVGDAHGVQSRFTAATGTVLAHNQTLVSPPTTSTPGERLTDVMLISCDVVSGESGGPTYDAAGTVVGMTTASVRSGTDRSGVAISVDSLRMVLRTLRSRAVQ